MKNVPKGHSSHSAFTMIELIYVIVILGILSAIAIPKFAGTKNMADINAARADVASIRSSIQTERQSQLIKGINTYIPKLSPTGATTGSTLFTGDGTRTLLKYGIVAGSSATAAGKWTVVAGSGELQYNFEADTTPVLFTYVPGTGSFDCNRTNATYGTICKKIVD